MRVIPFVEDTKNCLLFEPAKCWMTSQMASLQAALKSAIQVHYQLGRQRAGRRTAANPG
jgi:ABC-type cobalt transport system substrate-binding protein